MDSLAGRVASFTFLNVDAALVHEKMAKTIAEQLEKAIDIPDEHDILEMIEQDNTKAAKAAE